MSAAPFQVGDEVYLQRAVPLAGDSLISVEPGDLGVVEKIGDRFLAIRIQGMRVIVSKGDIVRADARGR